jgi:hypothetical protein
MASTTDFTYAAQVEQCIINNTTGNIRMECHHQMKTRINRTGIIVINASSTGISIGSEQWYQNEKQQQNESGSSE